MSRVGTKEKTIDQNEELEKRIEELEKFCKKLIEALEAVEKKTKNFYLPQGTYFGTTID